MSCFNFIIMKVNGADVSNLPYEDAVQLFLNAEEPIIVEVRRKCLSENNKLSFFNYDDDSPYKSPTLAVIASSSSASTENYPLLPHFRKDNIDAVPLLPKKQKPAIASVSCQTDLSTFDAEFNELLFMKNDDDSKSGVLYRRKSKPTTIKDVMADNFDDCLKTEFDFEEITLKKSRSTENLGFTISYCTDDFLASNSGSDENDDDGGCIKEDIQLKYDKDKEYSLLNEKCAPRCKIYVSDIVPNSLADQDGRLRQGDRILQINGQNVLEKVDHDSLLTENKYSVKILVSRYAFAGDDDFLDSAVYCDDKECQLDKLVSSNEYECEQTSFSSSAKSSYQPSKHGQAFPHSSSTFTGKTRSVNTCNTPCQILPSIATENVCDIFSHSNIKDQLETVSKEITFLNSQISVMKQLQTETSMSSDKHHQQQQQMSSSSCSPKKVKKKTLKYYNNYQTECRALMPRESTVKGSPDAVEHIYETILEDGESDVYYCSPFEGINERRVEEWLKSIGCPNSNIHCSIKDRGRTEIEPISVRLQKQNEAILDDYDNSSSAYNTGGSCSSAFLAFETSKPNTGSQNDCQNYRALVSKSISKTQSNQFSSVCRKPDFAINNKCQTDADRTQKPSTVISNDNPSKNTDCMATAVSVAAADSDGHSTLVAKSSVYRMCQSKAIEEYKDKDKSEMVWKVKRRPDGSRYIVRRVIKKHSVMTENTENSAIHQDSASAIDIDYKRHLYRVKERSRTRHHKAPAIPSKEKPHSQHWLV